MNKIATSPERTHHQRSNQGRIEASADETDPTAPRNHEVCGGEEEQPLERPTTWQLARLAALLATRPESVRLPPSEVVLEAMQVWDAAAKLMLVERQDRELWQALFSDETAPWKHRLATYAGEESGLRELLAEPRFDLERDVLPKLFPLQEDSPENRRKSLDQLFASVRRHGLLAGPEVERSEPLPRKVSGLTVRALVEARNQAR